MSIPLGYLSPQKIRPVTEAVQRPYAKNRIRALSRLSNYDPKEKSPAPSYYSEHMRSHDIKRKTWKSEIKAAFLPFDPEEYFEGNIIDKEW